MHIPILDPNILSKFEKWKEAVPNLISYVYLVHITR
jgi:hypothetical protein